MRFVDSIVVFLLASLLTSTISAERPPASWQRSVKLNTIDHRLLSVYIFVRQIQYENDCILYISSLILCLLCAQKETMRRHYLFSIGRVQKDE